MLLGILGIIITMTSLENRLENRYENKYDSVLYSNDPEKTKYQIIIKSDGLYIKIFNSDNFTLKRCRFILFSTLVELEYIDQTLTIHHMLETFEGKRHYKLFSYDHFCEIEKAVEQYHSRNGVIDYLKQITSEIAISIGGSEYREAKEDFVSNTNK